MDARLKAVRSEYALAAVSGLSTAREDVSRVAQAFGYSAEQLASVPADANLGLSCGNPTAFASLQPGETVVDLGCGGGLDVFLAARKVGPSGRAIGIDMTAEMLDLARRNAAKVDHGQPLTNVEFYKATIDNLPLGSASVDCVISNCVINLVHDKQAVFREIARVLKASGRAAISDIALKRPLPSELAADLGAYVGCIAGAISTVEYYCGMIEAGFSSIEIVETGSNLNAYALIDGQVGCCPPGNNCQAPGPAIHARLAALLRRYNVNDYAASVRVYAVKPG
jgi:arsenite methyltransferase